MHFAPPTLGALGPRLALCTFRPTKPHRSGRKSRPLLGFSANETGSGKTLGLSTAPARWVVLEAHRTATAAAGLTKVSEAG